MNIAVDFLHILAATLWVGGLLYHNVILPLSLKAIDPIQQVQLKLNIAKKFSFVSWISVIILIITGSMKVQHNALFDHGTNYGLALTFKIAFVINMVLIMAVMTFIFGKKIRDNSPKEGEEPSEDFLNLQRQLTSSGLTNLILGFLVIVFVIVIRLVK